MQRRWLVWVAMAALCVPQLRADEASKHVKVEQLLIAMRLDRSMDQLMPLIQQQVDGVVQSAPGRDSLTPAQQQATQEFQHKMMDLALHSVSWKAMEPEMVTLYMHAYSEQEIDGLVAFYRSPIGQTMLDKQPELAKGMLDISRQRVLAIQPQMQALMREYQSKMGVATPGKPVDAPPPTSAPGRRTPQ